MDFAKPAPSILLATGNSSVKASPREERVISLLTVLALITILPWLLYENNQILRNPVIDQPVWCDRFLFWLCSTLNRKKICYLKKLSPFSKASICKWAVIPGNPQVHLEAGICTWYAYTQMMPTRLCENLAFDFPRLYLYLPLRKLCTKRFTFVRQSELFILEIIWLLGQGEISLQVFTLVVAHQFCILHVPWTQHFPYVSHSDDWSVIHPLISLKCRARHFAKFYFICVRLSLRSKDLRRCQQLWDPFYKYSTF